MNIVEKIDFRKRRKNRAKKNPDTKGIEVIYDRKE